MSRWLVEQILRFYVRLAFGSECPMMLSQPDVWSTFFALPGRTFSTKPPTLRYCHCLKVL